MSFIIRDNFFAGMSLKYTGTDGSTYGAVNVLGMSCFIDNQSYSSKTLHWHQMKTLTSNVFATYYQCLRLQDNKAALKSCLLYLRLKKFQTSCQFGIWTRILWTKLGFTNALDHSAQGLLAHFCNQAQVLKTKQASFSQWLFLRIEKRKASEVNLRA